MCLFALFGAPRSQINLLGCAQDLQQLGTEIFLPFFFAFPTRFPGRMENLGMASGASDRAMDPLKKH